MAKARSTQSIVNSFPRWSNTRSDEQSVGFQLLNSAGTSLDYLLKQLEKISNNYYLPTAVISDIDIYYKFNLNYDYEFTKEDNDNTEFIFTPPTVSGHIGSNIYEVTIADKNNIETFWYNTYPTRISLGDTVVEDHFIASGYLIDSPLLSSGISTHITNQLTVKIDNGSSFIKVADIGIPSRGLVYITGKDRDYQDITEELVFIQNDTVKTLNEFSEVATSGINVYGIDDPETTTIHIASAAFNQDDYFIGYSYLDENVEGNASDLFWALGSGTQTNQYTLDLKTYDIDDIGLRTEGYTSKSAILQQELLNTLDSNIVPLDIAVEPFSDRLWIVDSGTLYLYKNELPYTSLKDLDGKNYHADSVIEPNSYYALLGDTIELNYIWKRQVNGFVCHRAWVIYPDGTKYSLENGSEITYHTDISSWIYGEPYSRVIRPSEYYTLSQRGDYIYCLEVKYTDDTKSLDKRIISVISKSPEKEFLLSDIGITTTAQGIDFDSEYNLWLCDASGVKYKINRHYDNMMIDFKRKIIYFREPYDRVDVF